LKRIEEVLEITLSPRGLLPSAEMSASVMPSAKNSWSESPERFWSGITATETSPPVTAAMRR
jgi:hypothetical protein